MPEDMQRDLRPRLLRALASTEIVSERAARVADARFAAWMLGRMTDGDVLQDVWAAFHDWTQRPVMDNPRAIPDSPLDVLAEVVLVRDSGNDTIRELADHPAHDVRKHLVAFLRKRPFNRETWDLLQGTKAQVQMVDALKSEITEEELAWLLAQVSIASAKLRVLIAGTLMTAPCTDTVVQMLETLKADPDATVRDKAFESLRVRAERIAMIPK